MRGNGKTVRRVLDVPVDAENSVSELAELIADLGAADGDVYARLYAQVQDAPFNASHTPPGYETLLRQRLLKGVEGSSKL